MLDKCFENQSFISFCNTSHSHVNKLSPYFNEYEEQQQCSRNYKPASRVSSKQASQSSFCFKYMLNLGNNVFKSMTITEKTDIQELASSFCQQNGIEEWVAALLVQELRKQKNKQIQNIKERQKILRASKGKQINKSLNSLKYEIIKQEKTNLSAEKKSIGKILKNKISNEKQNSHMKNQGQKQQQKITSRFQCSNVQLAQSSQSNRKSSPFSTALNSQRTARKQSKNQLSSSIKITEPSQSHFEHMFRRHQQIEKKKQLSRKASLEKIPFKPIINNLSRKIVDLKRNGQPTETQASASKQHKKQKNNQNCVDYEQDQKWISNKKQQRLRQKNSNKKIKLSRQNSKDKSLTTSLNHIQNGERKNKIINNILRY